MDITSERVLAAARRGYFPWCHLGPLKWWTRRQRMVLFLPEQASTQAASIDHLHYLEISVMSGLALLLACAALWFTWRYRRSVQPLRTPFSCQCKPAAG